MRIHSSYFSLRGIAKPLPASPRMTSVAWACIEHVARPFWMTTRASALIHETGGVSRSSFGYDAASVVLRPQVG